MNSTRISYEFVGSFQLPGVLATSARASSSSPTRIQDVPSVKNKVTGPRPSFRRRPPFYHRALMRPKWFPRPSINIYIYNTYSLYIYIYIYIITIHL